MAVRVNRKRFGTESKLITLIGGRAKKFWVLSSEFEEDRREDEEVLSREC
jgi:hypothetical protein